MLAEYGAAIGNRFDLILIRFSAMDASAPLILFFILIAAFGCYWLIWGK